MMKTMIAASALSTLLLGAAAYAGAPSPLNMGTWRTGDLTISDPNAAPGEDTVEAWVETEVTVINPNATEVHALVIAYDADGQPVYCVDITLSPNATQTVRIDAGGAGGGAVKVLALDGTAPGAPVIAFQQDLFFARGNSAGTWTGGGELEGDVDGTIAAHGAVRGPVTLDVNARLSGKAAYRGDEVGTTTEAGHLEAQGAISAALNVTGTVALTSLTLAGGYGGAYAGKHLKTVPSILEWMVGTLADTFIPDEVSDAIGTVYDGVKSATGYDTTTTDAMIKESAKELEGGTSAPPQAVEEADTFEVGSMKGDVSLSGTGAGRFASTSGSVSGAIGLSGDITGSSPYAGTHDGMIDFDAAPTGGSGADINGGETEVGGRDEQGGAAGAGVTVTGAARGTADLMAHLNGPMDGTLEGDIVVGGTTETKVLSMAAAKSALVPLDVAFATAQLPEMLSYCGVE